MNSNRKRGRAGSTSSTSSTNSLKPRTAIRWTRFTRSNSEQPVEPPAKLAKSNSTFSLPAMSSTRVTRSTSALLKLKEQQEVIRSASESKKDIWVISSDDDHSRDYFPKRSVNAENKACTKMASKVSGNFESYENKHALKSPINDDSKVCLKMPSSSVNFTICNHNYSSEGPVNADNKACLKMPSSLSLNSAICDDNHSSESPVNFDSKACLKMPSSLSVNSAICDDNYSSENPVNTDSKVCLKMPSKLSGICNDDRSPKILVKADSKDCVKMPPGSSAGSDHNYSLKRHDNVKSGDPLTEKDKNDNFKSPFSVQRLSPLRMDEDFDIDTFLSSKEKVTPKVGESCSTIISTDISDDDFLSQFPIVDIHKINQVEQPKVKNPTASSIFSMNHNAAIPSTSKPNEELNNFALKLHNSSIAAKNAAEHAIATSSFQVKSSIATSTASKHNAGLTKINAKYWDNNFAVKNYSSFEHMTTSSNTPIKSNKVTSDNIEDNREFKSIGVKRRLDDFFDNDTKNVNTKKLKLGTNSKDYLLKSRSPLKDKDMNVKHEETESDDSYDSNSFFNDSNTFFNTDDEEAQNDMQDYAFPNLADDINFDVNAIRSNIHRTFKGQVVGDKRTQIYLKERLLTNECIQRLHNSLKSIPVDAIERDPHGLTVQLMPHQRHALTWMRWREGQKPSGGIIADDMGLGKTIQMIALILASKIEKEGSVRANAIESDSDDENDDKSRKIYDGKTLVVCPASVLGQWEREIQTKCNPGILRVKVYYGSDRNLATKQLAKYDVVLTTYHLVQQERDLHIAPSRKSFSKLFKVKWERVILDEAHYIRNYQTKMSISACELSAKTKWALTGTPIQNKKSDFYALLKFIKCDPFDNRNVWTRWIGENAKDANQRLKVVTTTLMLRRTKAELIEKGAIRALPQKSFNLIQVELDFEERIVYQKLLLYSQSFFHEFLELREDRLHEKKFGCRRKRKNIVQQEIPEKVSKFILLLMKHHVEANTHYILVLITRLRQMCCHPYLIKSMVDQEDNLGGGKHVDKSERIKAKIMKELDDITSNNDDDSDFEEAMAQRVMSKANHVFDYDRRGSKVRAVLDVLHNIIKKREKVVVVSQWTSFLKVIANNLDLMEGANYEMFYGQTTVTNRQRIVDQLNDKDHDLNVILLSLTAGGVGLNLIGANNLLLIDLHWNPQLETQAMERIYRFGQEHNVHIYKFVCKNTIEEKIKNLQDSKLAIAENVLTGSISNRLTIEDLKLLFS